MEAPSLIVTIVAAIVVVAFSRLLHQVRPALLPGALEWLPHTRPGVRGNVPATDCTAGGR